MSDTEALELIAEYVKVNDELREKMRVDAAERIRLEEKTSSLRKELERSEDALASAKQGKESFIDGLEQDLKRVRANLDAERQTTTRLERRVEGLDADLRAANSALDSVRSEVDALTASLSKEGRALQDSLSTIDSLRSQLAAAESADKHGHSQRISLESDLSHFKSRVSELEEHVVIITEGRQMAEEESSKLQDFVNALEREISSKDDAAKDFTRIKVSLEKDLDNAREELDQIYTEVSDWKQRAINAEETVHDNQSTATKEAHKTKGEHDKEVAALKSALAAAQSSAADFSKQSQALNNELTRALNENKSLQGEVTSLSRAAQGANRELASTTAQASDLRGRVASLEGIVDALQAEVADKERSILRLSTEYEGNLTSIREHYSAKMGELSDKNEQLEIRLQTEVEVLHEKLIATQRVAEQIEDLECKLRRREQEHGEEVAGKDATIADLTLSIKEQTTTCSRLRDERRILQSTNSEISQSLKESSEFESELRHKHERLLKAFDDRVQADGNKIKMLIDERDEISRNSQSAEDALHALTNKFRELKAKKEALGTTTSDQHKREEELRSTILIQNRQLSALRGAFEQLRSTNAVITKENEMIRKHTFKTRNGKLQDLNTLEGPRRHPKRFSSYQ